MKILELRFKNLNSLQGEWLIDFTDPEYAAIGIFALTGPTGSGKSTVLDAICLALYGKTPRLDRVNKSANEIMSRQTGECYAEVLFESQLGTFRCHWEQRRARKKPGGKLQDPEHQIVDARTERPIEIKKSRMGAVVEEKTGMDFDRFTRSILLAQGGFDTFLKADVEQKSKILEQITGTEIYSKISRRVHERRRGEEQKLNLLRAELSGVAVLSSEEQSALREKLARRKKEEGELAARAAAADRALRWLLRVDALKAELSSLADDSAALKRRAEAFEPDRVRLEGAQRAAALDGTYVALTAHREKRASDQAALSDAEVALATIEAREKQCSDSRRLAAQCTRETKERLKDAVSLIREVRLLDQKIEEKVAVRSQREALVAKDIERLETVRREHQGKSAYRISTKKKLEEAVCYLEENARDQWLVSGLAGVEHQLVNLFAKQKELAQKQADRTRVDEALNDAASQLDYAVAQCGCAKEKVAAARAVLEQKKRALAERLGGRLLREYRTEKEALLRERVYIQRIAELEEDRAHLKEGSPCPLCGSIDHPFAAGNIPDRDETEQRVESLTRLIDAVDELQIVVRDAERFCAIVERESHEKEARKAAAAHKKEMAERVRADWMSTLETCQSEFEKLQSAVIGQLRPLGIETLPESAGRELLESLQSRRAAWQEQDRERIDVEGQIAAIDSDLKRLDALRDDRAQALAESQQQLKQLQEAILLETERRMQLFGDRQPDEEEARLNEAVAIAERAEESAQINYAKQQQALSAQTREVVFLTERAQQSLCEQTSAETNFFAALMSAGWNDEPAFLAARVSPQEREILSARANSLARSATELNAKREDREQRLAAEIAHALTEKTLEQLRSQLSEVERALEQVRSAVAGLRHELAENEAAWGRMLEKKELVEAQSAACRRWNQLDELIGSAEGKKYRNFAQGLTFEHMVGYANQQLQKMTDRYLLLRARNAPLELNVIDQYQAGEQRSTRNLSGGESFLVSLALALGLSKMASQTVRVDSLFLDEGFGTLDEHALETALEALSSLQQEGKLIGMISHVSALKERIRTQIHVEPVLGGRSALSGPGCISLN